MGSDHNQGHFEHHVADPWFLKSSFPVFFPNNPFLTASDDDFEAHIRHHAKPRNNNGAVITPGLAEDGESDTNTVIFTPAETSSTGEIEERMNNMDVDSVESEGGDAAPSSAHPFMQGLLSHQKGGGNAHGVDMQDTANKMMTENDDVAYRSTTNPITLIANLAWLSRPVIQKKVSKDGDEDEMVIVENEQVDENDPARHDVKHGVAHGYWKDLLNLLALDANSKLDVLANPRDVLNIEAEKERRNWPKSQDEAKRLRRTLRDDRHRRAILRFTEDSTYQSLHLTIARLFAAQLKTDRALLASDNKDAKRHMSLCAKWAPSSERFADKHTFVVSSIAEILHPLSEFTGFAAHASASSEEQRTFYLRHARDAYRKDLAALRKQLEVVERDISADTYPNIKYDRVPSVAMNNYTALFAAKDPERFEQYIDKVAAGVARISGATLLPSVLVKLALEGPGGQQRHRQVNPAAGMRKTKTKRTRTLIDARIHETAGKALDGQWRALVQRIKDSGTLANSIAVADVSGSMQAPVFPDRTTPMHSSIGLALLIAEVCRPPFGGAFITFSTDPAVEQIDLSMTLREKVAQLSGAHWDMSTDFVAVFEKLVLPMALANKLKQEDMVKRVFVFSDMQFDSASMPERSNAHGYRPCAPHAVQDHRDWSTSYERIEKLFQDAGYDMPELVFWNLAGGRAGYMGGAGGDPVAPKPVTAAVPGTAMVSGYSQGMLKMFLDKGSYDADAEDAGEDEEEETVENVGEDGEVVVEKVKRRKLDPLSSVKRAVGHKAYAMLRVVD